MLDVEDILHRFEMEIINHSHPQYSSSLIHMVLSNMAISVGNNLFKAIFESLLVNHQHYRSLHQIFAEMISICTFVSFAKDNNSLSICIPYSTKLGTGSHFVDADFVVDIRSDRFVRPFICIT